MNRQQQYTRNPVPRRAGTAQTTRNQVYSDMVDSDDYGDDDVYDDQWPQPTPRSAIRYTTEQPVIVSGNRRYVLHNRLPQAPQQAVPQPRPPSRPQPQFRPRPQVQVQPEYDVEVDEPLQRPRQRRNRLRVHPVFVMGVGMFLMLLLWIGGTALFSWWNVTQDDWHYGRPRTFQMDAVVGHNHDSLQSPSHFIAMNFHAHIQIIEFPAGDTTKSRLYPGPVISGDGQDLAPVKLAFRDVNGDGKPDMIVIVASTHFVLLNDGSQFRMLKPGEQVSQY